jgi:copper chaperone CopZ
MTTTTYPVKGMSCAHCVNAVTAELTDSAGVSSVTVDLVPEGVSLVTLVTDRPLDEETVRAALDDAGGYLIVRE